MCNQQPFETRRTLAVTLGLGENKIRAIAPDVGGAFGAECYSDGKYFKANQVFLYTESKSEMDIYFSGVGVKAARCAGEFGDTLVTISSHNPLERLRDVIIPSFYEGARSAGKDPRKTKIALSLSFTLEDPKSFLKNERTTGEISAKNSWDVPDPRRFNR